MKRKNIAVCITGYNAESDTKIILGIKKRCMELDCNVLVFSAPIRRNNIEDSSNKVATNLLVRGENEIFNLINYKMVDGVILLGETFSTYETIYTIAGKCRKNNIPIVNVNDVSHSLQKNVLISGEDAMEELVEHLIKVHHLSRINFIGGIKGDQFSEKRLTSYMKALEKNGIPFERKRVGYGYYWEKAAECTAMFLEDELPQAIVCANDTMAIFCMDYLKNQGYSIPDDIIVTGYDGLQDIYSYSPKITSVQPDYNKAGAEAVNLILNCKDVNKAETVTVNSTLICQESCGCKPADTKKKKFQFIADKYGSNNSFKSFNHNVLGMYTNANQAENNYELCNMLIQGAWTFQFKSIYICLNSSIVNNTSTFFSEAKHKEYNGLDDKMVSMCRYGHSVPEGTVFNTSALIPDNRLELDHPVFLCFSPLHFKDIFLGYVAYESDGKYGHGEQFSVWVMTIASQLGFYFTKKELESMYITDPLTGLYNRRGMRVKFNEIVNSLPERKGFFVTICGDIDYLKKINDTYGHEAGDNAILRISAAIKAGFPKGSIAVRTGGDEYLIIIYSKTKIDPDKYISKVNAYLDKYNFGSGLPYKISASFGVWTIPAAEMISLDQLQKFADQKLYEVKALRKKEKFNEIL